MFLGEPDPFYLLLKKAECASGARAPAIIVGLADGGCFQQIDHPSSINASGAQGKVNSHVRVGSLVAVPVSLVGADGNVGMNNHAAVEVSLEPLFQRTQLELPRAPACA